MVEAILIISILTAALSLAMPLLTFSELYLGMDSDQLETVVNERRLYSSTILRAAVIALGYTILYILKIYAWKELIPQHNTETIMLVLTYALAAMVYTIASNKMASKPAYIMLLVGRTVFIAELYYCITVLRSNII